MSTVNAFMTYGAPRPAKHEYLTFKNLASYIKDGRTATLQMLHLIYIFFQQL